MGGVNHIRTIQSGSNKPELSTDVSVTAVLSKNVCLNFYLFCLSDTAVPAVVICSSL